jgi:glucose-1-phosphate cytidylyltransferase
MKVAILAGGYGSRLAEETEIRPKPLVEIGGYPILWHIMKIYAHYGYKDFVIALGYKGEMIKKYIVEAASLSGDLTVNFHTGEVDNRYARPRPDWNVELIDTGLNTLTGGRIKRLAPIIGNEPFMLTWGDGVADIDISALVKFHQAHGKLATVTAVHPPARYGSLDLDGDQVTAFAEKPQLQAGWINGAFFMLEPEIFDYIPGDQTQWEKGPLERLAAEGQLMAYKHTSFWQCMDTLREKHILEKLWSKENPPWKFWE